MKRINLVSFLSGVVLISSSVVFADNAQVVNKKEHRVNAIAGAVAAKSDMVDITCKEFLLLEDTLKPEHVRQAMIKIKGEKDPIKITTEEIKDKVTPIIVESCKKTPHESFLEKIKAHFKNSKL